MADPLEAAVAELQKKLHEQEETVIRTKTMINELCGFMNKPPLYNDTQLNTSKVAPVRSDTYYGQALQTAIRDVLHRRKAIGPAEPRQIYDALIAGGYNGFRTSDIQNRLIALRDSLRKNAKIFHKLPAGEWGLVEWYPKIREKRQAASTNGDADEQDDEDAADDKDEAGDDKE